MIITCENCSTRFNLDESLIRPEGTKVRCSQCSHVFVAAPPAPGPGDAPIELTSVAGTSHGDPSPDQAGDDTGYRDMAFATSFDEMDIEQDVAFDETDLSFGPEEETAEIPLVAKVQEDAAAVESPEEEMDIEQDVAFDESDLSFESEEETAEISQEAEISEEATAVEAPEEEADIEEDVAFDESDLSFGPEEETAGIPVETEAQEETEVQEDAAAIELPEEETAFEEEVAFDSPETDFPDLEMDEDQDDSEEFSEDFSDLEMEPSETDEDKDVELDGLEFEEIEFDDAPSFEAESADIEISFAEDTLEMSGETSDEVEFETEDISFDSQDFGQEDLAMDTDSSLGGLEMEDSGRENQADEILEPDLELSFEEEDEDLEEIEFDELTLEDSDPETADQEAPAFPEIDDFQPEDVAFEPEEEETEFDLPQEDEKFAEYDQVLDQETEPEETFPELDEELNDSEALPLEETPVPESEPSPEPEEEELDEGPLMPPQAEDGARRRRKKSGMGAPVKILALLFMLVIAAYLISLRLGIQIPFMDQVNIPFITQAFKPAPPPVAATGPIPNDASTKGRFETNASAGRIFVITGKVDNPDKIAYSHIRVKGTLLTKGNKKAVTQVIYCGNVVSEEVLKQGNISDITKELNVKAGKQNTNINIKPGASVRFMLVFSNLPENLTNFTVEVLDYKPAGPQ